MRPILSTMLAKAKMVKVAILPAALVVAASADGLMRQPLTVADVAVTFAGIALLWLAGVVISNNTSVTKLEVTVATKLGDGEGSLTKEIARLREHFTRFAEMTQRHEGEISTLQHDGKDQDRRMDRQDTALENHIRDTKE